MATNYLIRLLPVDARALVASARTPEPAVARSHASITTSSVGGAEQRWALQQRGGRVLLEGVTTASSVAGGVRRDTIRIDRRFAACPQEIAPLLQDAWRRRDELDDSSPVALALRRLVVVPKWVGAPGVGRPIYLDEDIAYLTFEVRTRSSRSKAYPGRSVACETNIRHRDTR